MRTLSIILLSIWLLITVALMVPLGIVSLFAFLSKDKSLYGNLMLFWFASIFSIGFNNIGMLYALFSEESTSKYLLDSAEADDIEVATKARYLVDAIFTKKELKQAEKMRVGQTITQFIQQRANNNELSDFGHIISRIINIFDFNHIILKNKK